MENNVKGISARQFIDFLSSKGFKYFTGVPCSYLTPLVNETVAAQHLEYINATNEGEALSLASGFVLSGEKAVVMCQNSGLGNMVNPITSLSHPFNIPCLILVTWRGKPGTQDEPQHQLMGKITPALLDLMEIESRELSQNIDEAIEQLETAINYMAIESKPYALIIDKDTFSSDLIVDSQEQGNELPTRYEVLQVLEKELPESVPVIATTGKTGRELFTINDRQNHLYCVGSMGFANALAAGIAHAKKQQTVVIDGDGAALMHLGNLATIGAHRISKLLHIILDNGSYDSTGGQPSISGEVDFLAIARGCGYRTTVKITSLCELEQALRTEHEGPALLLIPIAKGSLSKLGRPTVKPSAIATRFKTMLVNTNPNSR